MLMKYRNDNTVVAMRWKEKSKKRVPSVPSAALDSHQFQYYALNHCSLVRKVALHQNLHQPKLATEQKTQAHSEKKYQ